jgi:hypothetical protein
MLRFRSMKTLQKFSSVHAQVHNHSIRSCISSRGKSTNRDARPHWGSGVLLRRNPGLAEGRGALRVDETSLLLRRRERCCRCPEIGGGSEASLYSGSRRLDGQ